MRAYRCCFLNATNSVIDSTDLDAKTDNEACTQAVERCRTQPMSVQGYMVYDRDRCIRAATKIQPFDRPSP